MKILLENKVKSNSEKLKGAFGEKLRIAIICIVHLIFFTKIFAIEKEKKYYLGLPIDIKNEAMGSSTMLSALQKPYEEHKITGHLEIGNLFEFNIWKLFFNGYCKIRNFLIKAYCINYDINKKFKEADKLNNLLANISLQYFFEFNQSKIDLSALYNRAVMLGDVTILKDNICVDMFMHFISFNIKGTYSSKLGNISLNLDNFISTFWEDKFYKNNYLKRNLRIGYNKEFKLDYLLDKIQVALELDNLLMNSIYLNYEGKDYSLFKKFHLGICCLKEMGKSNNILELNVGIKNFFPTFGIGFKNDIFSIGYAFTNRDLGNEWGKERKIINLLSIGLNLANK